MLVTGRTLLYISGSRVPSKTANGIQVMKMCEAFADLGYDVTLLVREAEIDLDSAEAHDFYGVKDTFQLSYTADKLPDRFGIIHTFGCVVAAIKSKATLIYGRHIPSCILAGMLVRRVGLELHEAHTINGWIGRKIFRLAVRRKWIGPVVVISGALRKEVDDVLRGVPVDIVIAHDGAVETKDVAQEFKKRETERRRISVGYIGHLYEGRGFEIIAGAAKALAELEFHVVGGDEETVQMLKAQTADLENLHLHGFVAPAEARQFLDMFDIALAPYQESVRVAGQGRDTSRWMSPLKIFEYMAAGKPIVCSDLPVLREVLENGKTAILVPPGEVSVWVSALQALASDGVLRQRLGSAARAEAKRYSWRARAEKIITSLESATKR